MKELVDAIKVFGRSVKKDVLKVDMFLNHRIDTELLFKMGEELANHFASERPTMILTIEASGIALAVAAAHHLGNIPVVFAKKSQATNQSDDIEQVTSYSFTHQCETHVRVDKKYLPIGSRVLIIDDFLAQGNAVHALTTIVNNLGGKVCGVGIAIEKGFQKGGQALRAQGVNLKSLAIIQSLEDGDICVMND